MVAQPAAGMRRAALQRGRSPTVGLMPARPSKPCDEPTFLIPGLPLSMAAMNLLFALAFAGVRAIRCCERNRSRR